MLGKIVSDHQIEQLLISTPRISETRLAEIVRECEVHSVELKRMSIRIESVSDSRWRQSAARDQTVRYSLKPASVKFKISNYCDNPTRIRQALAAVSAGPARDPRRLVCGALVCRQYGCWYAPDVTQGGIELARMAVRWAPGDP